MANWPQNFPLIQSNGVLCPTPILILLHLPLLIVILPVVNKIANYPFLQLDLTCSASLQYIISSY